MSKYRFMKYCCNLLLEAGDYEENKYTVLVSHGAFISSLLSNISNLKTCEMLRSKYGNTYTGLIFFTFL